MPGVSKEQIAQAKEIDLLSYLQACEPGELVRTGNEYRTKSHHSLVISNGLWHWWSGNVGGKTALDYLIHVRGLGFVEAVETICDSRSAPNFSFQPVKSEPKKEKPEFILPEAERIPSKVVAYLQGRGIDSEIISRCLSDGSLYESRKYHNCVFVGKDGSGIARYAFLRGTYGDFRMDETGSDKRFGFCLHSCEPFSRFVAVCESPIDALSLASLRKMETAAWDRYHYLSLGGTSPLALIQFLQDNPIADHVYLYLDNDAAGRQGMAKIRQAIYENDTLDSQVHMITEEPPTGFKDYNDKLKYTIHEKKKPETVSRPLNRAADVR